MEPLMTLSGHNCRYIANRLLPILIEFMSFEEIMADIGRGCWIFDPRFDAPTDVVMDESRVFQSSEISLVHNQAIKQLWMIHEALEKRAHIYAQYASAADAPANLPPGEHEEVSRRICSVYSLDKQIMNELRKVLVKADAKLPDFQFFWFRRGWVLEVAK